MAVAPEPFRTACVEVLHNAAIKARVMAWDEEFDKEQLRDLMDAVHNIPRWLNNWQRCDVNELRQSLAYYDQQWASKGWPNLTKIFDENVAGTQPT